jgi:hypothetical protein
MIRAAAVGSGYRTERSLNGLKVECQCERLGLWADLNAHLP